MTIKAMVRVFEYAGVRFPDPDEKMTVEQVRGVFATQYPEIATAALTGPETLGDKCVYRFERAIGPAPCAWQTCQCGTRSRIRAVWHLLDLVVRLGFA